MNAKICYNDNYQILAMKRWETLIIKYFFNYPR
jgi:hypothetical protein